MDTDLLRILGEVAGIGGIALGTFLLIFRDVVRRQIFGRLDNVQTYRLFRLILILTWSIAVLGIGAWVYASSTRSQTPAALESEVTLDAGTYDVVQLVEELARLTGGVVLEAGLATKLKGRSVKFPSKLKSVSLKLVLDRIFTETGIRVDYVIVSGTVVVREKGAS